LRWAGTLSNRIIRSAQFWSIATDCKALTYIASHCYFYLLSFPRLIFIFLYRNIRTFSLTINFIVSFLRLAITHKFSLLSLIWLVGWNLFECHLALYPSLADSAALLAEFTLCRFIDLYLTWCLVTQASTSFRSVFVWLAFWEAFPISGGTYCSHAYLTLGTLSCILTLTILSDYFVLLTAST